MPVCIVGVFWRIELVVEGAADSDTLFFDIMTLTGETFTGQVRNFDGTITVPLSGRCSPLTGELDVSALHFDFTVLAKTTGTPVRILMVGTGHQPADEDDDPEFHGSFVAVEPAEGAASALSIPTQIDVGDTGTGTGTQT
jgi:hypothetical protein